MKMDRRNVLKLFAGSLAATQLPKSAHAAFESLNREFSLQNESPLIKFTGSSFSTAKFNGDNEDIPHDILWNRDGFIQRMGGIPKASESCDIAVIGGGLAGLLSSYWAPQRDVICFEQAPNFGGNAKGEIHAGRAIAQGSAYVVVPDEGDSVDLLLKELGLIGKVEEGSPVLFQNKLHHDLWSGSLDSSAKSEFDRIRASLENINENAFPTIPLDGTPDEMAEVKRLDKITFAAWLNKEFGAVHPLILEYFQIYCWSSFCASIDEISAAQALNFIAAECSGVMAFPGGNAMIAQRLYESVLKRRGGASLRASSFIVDVTELRDRVNVTTFENGKLKTIEAEKCVFAAPKFLPKTVMPNLDAGLKKAFDQIPYRAYLVANVKLREAFEAPAYDLFNLEGAVPPTPSAMKQSPRTITDVVTAEWASAHASDSSMLTLYLPLPFDGARQFLFHGESHDKYKSRVEKALAPHLETITGKPNSIEGIRMTRWGHALPLSRPGIIANGTAETIENAPGRVLFAGQDVWANPAIETAIATAERAVAKL